jgi:hypothetical protein
MGHPAKAGKKRNRQGVEPCLFLVAVGAGVFGENAEELPWRATLSY